MYTCCPECATVFRVPVALLTRAEGKARCGECRHVFNVYDRLYDDLAEVRGATAEQRRRLVETRYSAGNTGGDIVPDTADEDADAPSAPVLEPAAWQRQPLRGPDLARLLAILLLTVFLGLQWVWFNRLALAAEPAWRPRIEQLCALLDCRLPLRADPSLLVLLSRDVHRHPAVAGAIVINAVFENRAGFTQRYPVFEVSFTDHSGKPVAMRRFQPEEYLGNGVSIPAGLAPGARVAVALEVLDPGNGADSFQFEFL
jgi:predicted Zn finger-like uncharacterized protein